MASHEKASLRRAITAPMLMLFILGDVLGAGVYALAGTIAGRVGGAIWAPLLIALCFALLTAASYAELVTKYPRAGGAAVYAEKAFGKPLLSFLVGFSMIAAGVTSAAGLAVAFAGDYLQALISVPPQWVCVGFLVIVGLLNARGIKESLGANLLMTTIELSGLVMVIAAAACSSARVRAFRNGCSNWTRPPLQRPFWRHRCWRSIPLSVSKPPPTWLRKSRMYARFTHAPCSEHC